MASSARTTFLTHLNAYRRAVQEPVLLGNSPPKTRPDHSARLLRNGLSVVGLAIVEEFIRNRSAELLGAISLAGLPLGALPDKLRHAVTVGAVRVLAYQIQGMERDGEDPLPLTRQTARAIASSSRQRIAVAPISLHWTKSNISPDFIQESLQSLLVEKPVWTEMTRFAQRAGFTIPGSLKTVFSATLTERHRAAHRANNDALLLHVRAYARHALAVCMAYDALASRAARLCRDQDLGYGAGTGVTQATVPIRWIADTGSGFEERIAGGSVVASSSRLRDARRDSIRRAKPNGEVVIQLDRNSVPDWWQVTDL